MRWFCYYFGISKSHGPWCVCSGSEGPPELIENGEDSSEASDVEDIAAPSNSVEAARAELSTFCQYCPEASAEDLKSFIRPAWDQHLNAVKAMDLTEAAALDIWRPTAEVCFWMAVLWARKWDLVRVLVDLFRSGLCSIQVTTTVSRR